MRNPHEYEQHVLLEKFPFKAGKILLHTILDWGAYLSINRSTAIHGLFVNLYVDLISGFSSELTEFVVDAESEVTLRITWTPSEAGSCRQMTLFLVEGAYRLQAVFFGQCEEPPKAKKVRLLL